MGMTDSTSTSAVICDAGPLIHLDELNQLSLLGDFMKIFVTRTVLKEVEKHRAINFSHLPIEIVSETPLDLGLSALAVILGLHAGELSALSYARNHPQVIFLTDDSAARQAAVQINLRVHGTIGILLRSVRRGLKSVSEIKSCLQSIPSRSTLHLQANLLRSAIEELERYAKGLCLNPMVVLKNKDLESFQNLQGLIV